MNKTTLVVSYRLTTRVETVSKVTERMVCYSGEVAARVFASVTHSVTCARLGV